MSNDGVILQKQPGHLIPKEAYEAAAKGANTMGYVGLIDGELIPITETPMTVDKFMEFQEQNKEEMLLVYLGKHANNDTQPFILMENTEGEGDDAEQTIFMVGMAEGDFSKYRKDPAKPGMGKADAHSDEHYMFEELVKPIFTQYEEQVPEGTEPSLSGLMEYLEDEKVSAPLIAASEGGRSVIKLMSNEGELISFATNKMGLVADWGSMSQVLGYKDPSLKEETPTKKGWWKNKATKAADEPLPVPPKEEPVVVDPKADPKPDVKVGAPLPPKPEEGIKPDDIFIRPITGISHKEMKAVYNIGCGFTPSNENSEVSWKARPWIKADKARLDKVNKKHFESKKGSEMAASLGKPAETFKKDVAPHDIPTAKDIENQAKAGEIQVVPTAQVDWFKKSFLESVDIKKLMSGVQGIPTIAEIEAIETKYASFFEKTGIHLEETFKWPFAKRVEFAVNAPHLSALLGVAYVNNIVKSLLETPVKDLVATAPDNKPKAEEPVAPVAKGGFWKKKAESKAA